jgi:phosphatidylglycerol lysyltransferase
MHRDGGGEITAARPLARHENSPVANRLGDRANRPGTSLAELAGAESSRRDTHLTLLRRHGQHTLAYASLHQDGMEVQGDENGIVAVTRKWGTTHVIGDPIAPPERVPALLRNVIEHNRHVSFWQVSRSTAEILCGLGFSVNEMGYDTIIDLPTYDLEGSQKRNLRMGVNRLARLGYSVREFEASKVDWDSVVRVSERWRRTRTQKRREMTVINRPARFEHEEDARQFYLCDPEGHIAGFLYCDPIYRDNRIVGFSTANRRIDPACDPKLGIALVCAAIMTLKAEGFERLTLGLSPLAGIRDGDLPSNRLVRFQFRMVYRSRIINSWFFPVQGHAEHKRSFGGIRETCYFASSARFNTFRFAAFLKRIGVW